MIAKQSAYLTEDRKSVVAEGESGAKFLLVREGCEIADSEVAKYPGAAKVIGGEVKKDPAQEPAHTKGKK
jgi:hypothetical protein